ncbi:3-deoxy-D-manno-octulosonic acid transferase [Roseivivax sp. GX 12232]|uniref:3-deoxy-D-manno-octulosonic acid transferase n=1 Tax=Roseivivax sp. GX 12232 TaxID=2900547 RepID=UPI001E406AB3|nr:glycosyltransferase N-terminal domain-containing protein [Roseivivax sp. GX 12232]MCE0506058.1 3-deoxy-D-manno-octulosonic acid transferase [Roseivivax sp. GX 12232]
MSRRPFSLSAYLALVRPAEPRPGSGPESAGTGAGAPPGARPPGRILWLHAASREDRPALAALAPRLLQQMPELNILRTGAWDGEETAALPEDSLPQARAFLTHWRPDLMVWAGHALRPALMEAVHHARLPAILVNAEDTPFTTPAPRWLPDAAPAALARFSDIFCATREAERRVRRLALPGPRIERSGALSAAPPPLDCAPESHEEVATALGGRPVWLAARARADEMRRIFDAHVSASRLAHRLLLVVVPERPEDAEAARAAAEATGLRAARWEAGEMPDDMTQILLVEGTEELGLWYRVAPLAFLGGSLAPRHGGTDPLEAAALGSAILYGPNVGRHLGTYSRLVEAGAARIVRDAHSLASAVSHLIAPDRAAAMAHAGWDVVTSGAKTEDRIVARIAELLDDRPPEEGEP